MQPAQKTTAPVKKAQAFTVDLKPDEEEKKTAKVDRSDSPKKKVRVFGSEVEILVSEKDISKIERRKKQQELE